jgi:hypothetical protein
MLNWWQASYLAASLMRVNCSVLLVLASLSFAFQKEVQAEYRVLQNDSLSAGRAAAVAVGMEANDVAASVFILPSDIDLFTITKVQVFWDVNPVYAGFDTVCDLNLYCGGPPNPGPAISTIQGLKLQPGYLNEIEVVPGWPVRAGLPFVIGIRYSWTVGEIDQTSSHITSDYDGCQTGKNLLYDSRTSAWIDPCAAGMPGDFIIRVGGVAERAKLAYGDANHDGSVDMSDFGAFQRCFAGAENAPEAGCLADFDCNLDGQVNQLDLEQFLTCIKGPAIPLDPNCGGECLPLGICLPESWSAWLAGARDENPSFGLWGWIGILILVLLAILVGRYYLSKNQMRAGLNGWKANPRCPSQGSPDSKCLNAAMVYLQDNLGRTDPEAKAIGKFLLDNDYDTCGSVSIAVGSNPNGFYAHNPPGTPYVVVDRQFVENRYSPEGLALILYAECSHFLNANGAPDPCFDESACQKRLDTFRERHKLKEVLPELRHGLPEGIAEKDTTPSVPENYVEDPLVGSVGVGYGSLCP